MQTSRHTSLNERFGEQRERECLSGIIELEVSPLPREREREREDEEAEECWLGRQKDVLVMIRKSIEEHEQIFYSIEFHFRFVWLIFLIVNWADRRDVFCYFSFHPQC